ncbi:MAG: entericidin A/B family lipoprotein [Candidatus Competibacteraceae bacterium]
MLKKSLLLLSLLSVLGLMGCNTMKGMGQDVSAAGDAVSNTAKKDKTY